MFFENMLLPASINSEMHAMYCHTFSNELLWWNIPPETFTQMPFYFILELSELEWDFAAEP